ncbi:hypothetical protein BC332_14159 [Capsicum chinense]|nr:hypothetical protein BC332_14159 [Capsicum chinense]
MIGNIGDGDFLLSDHLKRDEENSYQLTPKGNTVFHVAVLYGHSHFVAEVLKITPALLCCQNKKNETALHIAANEGHTEVVRVLLACVEDHNTKEKLTRMTDTSGDTALHKAVRSQHLDVVKLLVKEDHEFEFPSNHAHETPLHLAAESGFHDALINILESCNKPSNISVGPSKRTPLHAAVIQKHKGLADVVSDMLAWKKSLVYLPAGSENDWTTAIHIASGEGDVNMIEKLLNHYPDCRDTLNSNSQNALHVTVLNNQDEVVCVLLGSDKCDSLVDEPDSDGNTPVHLLAASGNHVPELINHPRAKKMSFNKQNQTPLDIALSCTATTKKEKLMEDLCSIGQFGKRDFEVKWKYEYMPNPNAETGAGGKIQLWEDDQEKAKKKDQAYVETIMKSAQMHIVMATLIMTVTFAAGITFVGDTGVTGLRPFTRSQSRELQRLQGAFMKMDAVELIANSPKGVVVEGLDSVNVIVVHNFLIVLHNVLEVHQQMEPLHMETETSNAQTVDQNVLNALVANHESLSLDVARVNAGLDKLGVEVASISGRMERVEIQQSYRPSTPKNTSPTFTPKSTHPRIYPPNAISQANYYSQGQGLEGPSHSLHHQVPHDGLGTQMPPLNPTPPNQNQPIQRPPPLNTNLPYQIPNVQNPPMQEERFVRENRKGRV